MTLAEHLREARKRLLLAVAGLALGMIGAFFLTDAVIWLITQPLRAIASTQSDVGRVELMFSTVTSAFDLRLRMSIAIGVLISSPVWLWQIWAFINPGLTRREIRSTLGFAVAAVPLFFSGCYVGLVVMPHIVELMSGFVPAGGAAFYEAGYYYDFVLKLLLVLGVAFVLPVFLVALNLAGIASGKAIMRGWRIAVLCASAFAALATPAADVVSMLMLAGILIALFFAAAGLALVLDRRRSRRLSQGALPTETARTRRARPTDRRKA
jgi:sec-independent protein translocase protein TatC